MDEELKKLMGAKVVAIGNCEIYFDNGMSVGFNQWEAYISEYKKEEIIRSNIIQYDPNHIDLSPTPSGVFEAKCIRNVVKKGKAVFRKGNVYLFKTEAGSTDQVAVNELNVVHLIRNWEFDQHFVIREGT